MKKFLLILVTFLLLEGKNFVAAEENIACCSSSYSSSESCLSCLKGFFFSADYLYWKPVEDQLQYAVTLNGTSVETSTLFCLIDHDFHYSSGFRIGMGYTFDCGCFSGWECSLDWTRFHQKDHSSTSAPVVLAPLIAGLVDGNPPAGTSASSALNFKFDVVDLEISKHFSPFCCLDFIPFVGIEGARIDQHQRVNYFGISGLSDAQVMRTNNFHGIGPILGLETQWYVWCRNLDFFGSVASSLIYGNMDTHDDYLFVNGTTRTPKECTRDHCLARPSLQMQLGAEYHGCLCDTHPFHLKLAYEAQCWWSQWEATTSFIAASFVAIHPEGMLILKGLTAEARFDF